MSLSGRYSWKGITIQCMFSNQSQFSNRWASDDSSPLHVTRCASYNNSRFTNNIEFKTVRLAPVT